MLRRLIIMILEIKKDLESAHVGAYAAQSAYFIILSFLPLTIMLLSLVQFTGVGKADLYNLIQTVIPLGFRSWVIGMVDEMYSRTIATISLSALVMVWSAGKSFMALNRLPVWTSGFLRTLRGNPQTFLQRIPRLQTSAQIQNRSGRMSQ